MVRQAVVAVVTLAGFAVEADAVVYGGSSAGVMAAIAAR
jgi:hypothetical protein